MKLQNIVGKIVETVTPAGIFRDDFRTSDGKLLFQDKLFDLSLYESIYVSGVGKAASAQVKELYSILRNDFKIRSKLSRGTVFTKYNHSIKSTDFDSYESGHPLCDQNSVEAANKLKEYVQNVDPNSLLIVCVSGGASAILARPIPEFDLDFKIGVASELLSNGASIEEMNKIRRELSEIKNGGVADFTFCRDLLVLTISDVSSNDLGIIGSGPCTFEYFDKDELITIVKKYLSKTYAVPIVDYLNSPKREQRLRARQKNLEAKNIYNFIIADFYNLIRNAVDIFEKEWGKWVKAPQEPLIGDIGAGIEKHVSIFENMLRDKNDRFCLVTGGEYTVNVTGDGIGGRNLEFVLRLTKHLFKDNVLKLDENELKKISFCSVGTDGTDGPTKYAGSFMNYDLYQKSIQMGLDLDDFLERNDSLNFFEPLGSAIETGPTNTNVMDLRVITYGEDQ